jgi:pyruvate/2-oxoglutarate dehydrogenase complex dihydrolipoamide acyltransferase (E2) component
MNRFTHQTLELHLGISMEEMTMRALTIALSIALIGGGALAQTPSYSPASPTPSPGAATAPATPPAPGAPLNDRNPAIATGTTQSSTPAKGKNSFTAAQVRKRLEEHGYTNVADLKQDHDGIWRGQAHKGGTTSNVWLDYRGNVGQE